MKNFKGKSFLAILSLSLVSLAASASTSTSTSAQSLVSIIDSMLGSSASVIKNNVVNNNAKSSLSGGSGAGQGWMSVLAQQKQAEQTEEVIKKKEEVSAREIGEEKKSKELKEKKSKELKELNELRKQLAEAKKLLEEQNERAKKAEAAKKVEETKKADEAKKAEAVKKAEEAKVKIEELKKKAEELKKDRKKDRKNKKADKGVKNRKGGRRSRSADDGKSKDGKRMKGRNALNKNKKNDKGKTSPLDKLKDLAPGSGIGGQNGGGLNPLLPQQKVQGVELFAGQEYDVNDYNEVLLAYCARVNSLLEAKKSLEKLKEGAGASGNVSAYLVQDKLNNLNLPDSTKKYIDGVLGSGNAQFGFGSSSISVSSVDALIKVLKDNIDAVFNTCSRTVAFQNGDADGMKKLKLKSFKGFDSLGVGGSVLSSVEAIPQLNLNQQQSPAVMSFASAISNRNVSDLVEIFEILHRKNIAPDKKVEEINGVFGAAGLSPITVENLAEFSKYLSSCLGAKVSSAIKVDKKAIREALPYKTFNEYSVKNPVKANRLELAGICVQVLDPSFSGIPLTSTVDSATSILNLSFLYDDEIIDALEKDIAPFSDTDVIKRVWVDAATPGKSLISRDKSLYDSVVKAIKYIKSNNSNAFANVLKVYRELFGKNFDDNVMFTTSLTSSLVAEVKEVLGVLDKIAEYSKALEGNEVKGAISSFIIANLMDNNMLKKFGSDTSTLDESDSYRSSGSYGELLTTFVDKSRKYLEGVKALAERATTDTKVLSALASARPMLEAVRYPAVKLKFIIDLLNAPASSFKELSESKIKKSGVEVQQSDTLYKWLGESGGLSMLDALMYTFVSNFLVFKLAVPAVVTQTLNNANNAKAVFNGNGDLKVADENSADSGKNVTAALIGATCPSEAFFNGGDYKISGSNVARKLLWTGKEGTLINRARGFFEKGSAAKRKALIEKFSTIVRGAVATDNVVTTYLGTNGAGVRKSDYVLNNNSAFESRSNLFDTLKELLSGDTLFEALNAIQELPADGNYTLENMNFKLPKYLFDAIRSYYEKVSPVKKQGSVDIALHADDLIEGLRDANGNVVAAKRSTMFDAIMHDKLKIESESDIAARSGDTSVASNLTYNSNSSSSLISDSDKKLFGDIFGNKTNTGSGSGTPAVGTGSYYFTIF